MADATINLKIKGVKELKAELKDLKDQLAGLTPNSEAWAEVSDKAGDINKKLNSINKGVKDMSKGGNIDQVTHSFEGMKESLMNLDFTGAAKQASIFQQTIGSLNKGDLLKPFKSLISVVQSLSKAFIKFGLSLLANPIFLIAAAIAALVAIIAVIMNKLGILKPVLKAIGDAFAFIMKIIDGIVAAFEMLTDWLGLTANAAEDSAERQIKANKAVADSADKLQKKVLKDLDQKIELAKIDGENTKDMEQLKRDAIIKTSQIRYEALKAQLASNKISQSLSKEEIKGIMDGMTEARNMIQTAKFDNIKARHQDVADAKKSNEEKLKNDKSAGEKAAAQRKQFEADRISALRSIKDLELELMSEGIDKELAMNQEKYKRLIEDTKNNEKLLASEKAATIALLKEQEFTNTKAINQKYDDELAAILKASTDNKNAAAIEAEQTRVATMTAISEEFARKNKEAAQKSLDQEKAYKEARLNLGSSLVEGLKGLESLLAAAGVKTAGLQKTIALVQIATDTAKAISSVIAGATAAAAAGGPAAPFLLAGYIASGIGTVLSAVASAYTALKKAPPIGGGVSGSAPSANSIPSATPQTSLFGQANQGNNVSSPKDVESGQQQMVVKAVVVESDITQSQNHVNKLKQNAYL